MREKPKRQPVIGKPADILAVRGCRWPVTGAPPHLFCNAARERGSYCAVHSAISKGSRNVPAPLKSLNLSSASCTQPNPPRLTTPTRAGLP